jgi:bifunctional non-homologous end joining protein LigD
MPLEQYRKKRAFTETPEPRGQRPPKQAALRFVVQKHHARRMHYDFRLELDGVLKSWAIPKGPSLNPQDKRLAIMVEDHPLEYESFEGVIPQGNYGAGTVMVWDEGAYTAPGIEDQSESERALKAGLEKGDLKFVLYGKKLSGEFALVRLKKGKGNEWLLIKKRDRFASAEAPSGVDRSVLSHRTMEEIAALAPGEGKIWVARPESSKGVSVLASSSTPFEDSGRATHAQRKNDPMPRKVKPMLATPVDRPFDRPGWLFEIKWDGWRVLAEIEDGRVNLYSRASLSYNERFPTLVRSLESFQHDALLDGEVVVVDKDGQPNLQLLQHYSKDPQGQLVYYVFDLLYLDGEDLRDRPLWRRKEMLKPLLRGMSNVLYCDHIEEKGKAFFEEIRKRGLEGMVAKRAASLYQAGRRGPNWLKIKTHRRQEAVIAGFTLPRKSRLFFGALILGVYENDRLVHVGRVGTGFDTKLLKDLYARLEPLLQKKCPFQKTPKTDSPARWVEPRLVCDVDFADWTEDGHMRHMVFLGLREDKKPKDVHREKSTPVSEIVAGDRPSAIGNRPKADSGTTTDGRKPIADSRRRETLPFTFTNLDKVYWPVEGYTKGDLIAYYRDVAPFVLPHLKDRPLSLHRHPNGIDGKSFFQKDISRQAPPAWISTADIPSEHRGKPIRYVLCQDEPSLMYLANLGSIEVNCWNSRTGHLERPDFAVIDLDPQDLPYTQVVETAQTVHALLDKADAECFVKTSGKRGMHIFVPLGGKYDYDHVRQFAEIVALLVHRRLPQFTSVVRNPAERRQRVYLDFLQNRRGSTMAAPYSVRPVPGATVSTPLLWKEVKKNLDPGTFTMQTIPARLDKLGDLWARLLDHDGVDLVDCIGLLGKLSERER